MTTALYRLRLARGQSLRQLAADAGLSYETIRRVERGDIAVRPSTRVALERALDVPFDVLTAPLNSDGVPRDAAKTAVTTAESSQEV